MAKIGLLGKNSKRQCLKVPKSQILTCGPKRFATLQILLRNAIGPSWHRTPWRKKSWIFLLPQVAEANKSQHFMMLNENMTHRDVWFIMIYLISIDFGWSMDASRISNRFSQTWWYDMPSTGFEKNLVANGVDKRTIRLCQQWRELFKWLMCVATKPRVG